MVKHAMLFDRHMQQKTSIMRHTERSSGHGAVNRLIYLFRELR